MKSQFQSSRRWAASLEIKARLRFPPVPRKRTGGRALLSRRFVPDQLRLREKLVPGFRISSSDSVASEAEAPEHLVEDPWQEDDCVSWAVGHPTGSATKGRAVTSSIIAGADAATDPGRLDQLHRQQQSAGGSVRSKQEEEDEQGTEGLGPSGASDSPGPKVESCQEEIAQERILLSQPPSVSPLVSRT